jgi:hypothetical protein
LAQKFEITLIFGHAMIQNLVMRGVKSHELVYPQANLKTILLLVLEGKRWKEISEELNVPLSTASSFYQRRMRKIITYLKKYIYLGFPPQAQAEIPVNQLQSLEDFLLYLSELERAKSPQHNESSNLVKIGQWLDRFVDAGWQTIEHLLNPQQLGLASKSAVSMTRGQKIDLGMHLEKISVALVVKIAAGAEGEADILTQVYPVGNHVLPQGMKLNIHDKSG